MHTNILCYQTLTTSLFSPFTISQCIYKGSKFRLRDNRWAMRWLWKRWSNKSLMPKWDCSIKVNWIILSRSSDKIWSYTFVLYVYYVSDTVVIPRELFRNNENERIHYKNNSKCSTFVKYKSRQQETIT